MIDDYDFQNIESKWRKKWEEMQLFQDSLKEPLSENNKKEFLLFAFGYPSAQGLHIGHVESKTALDILARFKRMNGVKVFFPVGWDAFGLPAENYAIKTSVHPRITTENAIKTFDEQIKKLGISYDWKTELATCDPKYYRWTQWIFLELYKKGLAYKKVSPVNWCPSCQTVLANEQVIDGLCERCSTSVKQKSMDQWFFKITEYENELITGLNSVDWPNSTKLQQKHWVGRSDGINIEYGIDGMGKTITCFTTRPDTNFGATFIVTAPESSFVKENFESFSNKDEIQKYIESAKNKTDLERIGEGAKKTGVFTGLYAVSPLNGKKLPIYVSDFVLVNVGTGSVVGVPAHDMRDYDFALEKGLEIIRVVIGTDNNSGSIENKSQVEENDGIAVNSGFLDGMTTSEAKEKIMDYLEAKGFGKRTTNFKLRDWLISRQRYWGAPIPIVYDPEGNPHAIETEHLPWLLPTDVDFLPTGESPLKSSKELKDRVESLYGKGWTPEYDTMDTFVDSSWYFIRYLGVNDENELAPKDLLEKWLPVDFYLIGAEHTVLHLLYSRFFTKFLRDSGYVSFDEPFMKMRHQGMILGTDGKKMSKSKGNVINPDDIIKSHGADSLRVYEMFMAPLETDKPWNTDSLSGVYRFLKRIWSQINDKSKVNDEQTSLEMSRKLNKTIKYVSEAIPELRFNTCISKFMELSNALEKEGNNLNRTDAIKFVKLLAPFAPFVSDELYNKLEINNDGVRSVHLESWPVYDSKLANDDVFNIIIQVNGKLRGVLKDVSADISNMDIESMAKEKIGDHLGGHRIIRTVVLPKKLINFVID